jgi:hypothetical protein
MPIDMSAAHTIKPPPRKAIGTTRKNQQLVTTDSSQRDRRAEGLDGIAQLAQGVLVMARQYADAAAIGKHLPPVNVELANLAEHYESIAKPIDVIIQVGPFGALIAAGMPLVMQLLANHKIVDAGTGIGGVVPPEVLEAQMRADMARMQAQAMIEQQRAIQDAQKAQEQYEDLIRQSQEKIS